MKGIREDLRQRCVEAYNAGHCLIANSSSDSRRLRKACERGDLVSPAKGVFALPEIWRDLKPRVREWQKLQALAMLHPDWVFSHTSAAVIHGLYVSNDKLGTVHIANERRSHGRSTASVARHVIEGDVPKRIRYAKASFPLFGAHPTRETQRRLSTTLFPSMGIIRVMCPSWRDTVRRLGTLLIHRRNRFFLGEAVSAGVRTEGVTARPRPSVGQDKTPIY